MIGGRNGRAGWSILVVTIRSSSFHIDGVLRESAWEGVPGPQVEEYLVASKALGCTVSR